MLISLCTLLSLPNADDPYNREAAELYKTDRALFDAKVREHVKQYAANR